MFKSRIVKTAIAFTSYLAAIISAPHQALAQLYVGRYGIQPGLEQNYLQYQLSGRDLTQLRGVPVCNVGFGAGCDKSATILQQIVESNNGPTYQELVIRAAGGEANFQNFASYYGNNPNLSLVPLSSFWANDDPYILDGYRYTLGQSVNRTPVQGLGQVTKNFYWSPERSGTSESLRDGLLDLKYAYGRLLLEEAAKIPNVRQQIQALNLPSEVKQFYAGQFSQGVRSLRSGNQAQLQNNILEVLSLPFNHSNAEFNRPPLGIPEEYASLAGIALPGDSFIAAVPANLPVGEAASLLPPFLVEGDVVSQAVPGGGRTGGFPFWVLGAIPLALLPFAFGGGGDDDSDTENVPPPVAPPVGEQPPTEQPPIAVVPPPVGEQPPTEQPPVTPPPVGEQPPTEQPPVTPPPVGEQPPTEQPPVTPPPVGEQPPTEQPPVTPPPVGEQPPVRIPESSTLTPLLVLTLVMSLFGYKKWRVRKG
ncbi:hypothetical protein WA1_37090 [Scytonema hofmannii PCC 7110]|uniref:Exosortase n=1 Tax=Scytonema hofmannii PCC 7110 TaxID=128403 RepID=A0A139X108_9CYAN|nr:hypothetical protein [Scytonema hofmannii]KYC38399.1 hypothetical protein WA1_37090 [Scytonema hofmannii PCC 7110]